ncbi:MAG: GNAT family N-acetyltransferase [Pseudomonadota bacterium]
MPTTTLNIRFAQPGDEPIILNLIQQLADYERLGHEVVNTTELLQSALFGEHPAAEALLAFQSGQPLGLALFFHTYSTFVGRKSLYLEDLFVVDSARGQGIGVALLQRLASLALERQCGRMDWCVLNWNQPAIEFYQRIGARPMAEWTDYRLEGDALSAFAASTQSITKRQNGHSVG